MDERPQDAPYRRAVVVANPISGRGRAARAARELSLGLRSAGVGAELFLTPARGEAVGRLRCLEEDVDLVVAVGGDGTLREVLEGLADPEIPVGLLPFGTANVLASELSIPRDVHRSLEVLLRRHVVPIDTARVNGVLSFLVVGVGIDAIAVREVERRRRGPITKWTYVDAVLRALRTYDPPRLRVVLDGEEEIEEAGFLLISNVISYAGVLDLARDARIDDGELEVYVFPTGHRVELATAFFRGFLHRLPGGAVRMRRARRVRVEAALPVPYQVDGDFGGETPVEVEVGPNQYRLVVP